MKDTHYYGGIYFPDRFTMKTHARCGMEFPANKPFPRVSDTGGATCAECRRLNGDLPLFKVKRGKRRRK